MEGAEPDPGLRGWGSGRLRRERAGGASLGGEVKPGGEAPERWDRAAEQRCWVSGREGRTWGGI